MILIFWIKKILSLIVSICKRKVEIYFELTLLKIEILYSDLKYFFEGLSNEELIIYFLFSFTVLSILIKLLV